MRTASDDADAAAVGREPWSAASMLAGAIALAAVALGFVVVAASFPQFLLSFGRPPDDPRADFILGLLAWIALASSLVGVSTGLVAFGRRERVSAALAGLLASLVALIPAFAVTLPTMGKAFSRAFFGV